MSQKNFKIILSLTILFVFFIRFFYSVPNAPVLDWDAVSSVQGARSIIETGIPTRLGVFYPRDYLAHYLLAGSIFLVGDNSLGYALPNLIFSVLVLTLLYFIARTLTKNKIVIFLTIFFVAISAPENFYAVNPRSYMQFQFFFLLTVFCFYKGFVEKNNKEEKNSESYSKQSKKYQFLTIFSYIASVLSHSSGTMLLPIFGIYTLVKNKKWYLNKTIIIIFTTITLFSILFLCVKHPLQTVNPDKITFDLPCDFHFVVPFLKKETADLTNKTWEGPSGISLSYSDISYPLYLFYYLPFICLFIFFGIIKLVKKRKRELVYFYYIFFSSLFFVSLFTNGEGFRYIFCIFPIFVLLVFLGVSDFIEFVNIKKERIKRLAWIAILFLSLFLSLFFFSIIQNKSVSNSLSGSGFSLVYNFHPFHYAEYQRPIVSYLSENIQKGDIIISDYPQIYHFYLNQCDYHLIQREVMDGEKMIWQELRMKDKRQPIIFAPEIDSVDKLKEVLNNNQRVWLVKSRESVGPEICQYIEENMKLEFSSNNIFLYFFEK